MRLLVSACLLGAPCRYDGKSMPLPADVVRRLLEKHTCIPFCPEVYGGLSTPRPPAECREEGVFTREGKDVTAQFEAGAAEAVRMAVLLGCDGALLKERSPSCGRGYVYDGTFTGTLREGEGRTAAALLTRGIPVWGESRIGELLGE